MYPEYLYSIIFSDNGYVYLAVDKNIKVQYTVSSENVTLFFITYIKYNYEYAIYNNKSRFDLI